jgi:hypothetical protein
MSPEQPALCQAIAIERARLLCLVWQNIVALRQVTAESQQLIALARAERAATRGMSAIAAPPPSTAQDARP